MRLWLPGRTTVGSQDIGIGVRDGSGWGAGGRSVPGTTPSGSAAVGSATGDDGPFTAGIGGSGTGSRPIGNLWFLPVTHRLVAAFAPGFGSETGH